MILSRGDVLARGTRGVGLRLRKGVIDRKLRSWQVTTYTDLGGWRMQEFCYQGQVVGCRGAEGRAVWGFGLGLRKEVIDRQLKS